VFPVFAEALDEVCGLLSEGLGCSLREVLFGSSGSGGADVLDRTLFTQAGLFAVEVALLRLVESWGVRPQYVLGHSVGEVAAVFAAGVLSLGDACRLVLARGRLMQELPVGGVMVAVEASEGEVVGDLVGLESVVGLAAVNGPRSVVVSGVEDVVVGLVERWRGRGWRVKRLRVSHAFHSPLMDPMLEGFAEVVGGLVFGVPRLGVVSGVSGGLVDGEVLGSVGYWVGQVRRTVRFADGVGWLAGCGVGRFVEVGPGGVLAAQARLCLAGDGEVGGDRVVVPLLRTDRDETEAALTALSTLHVHGADADWKRVFAGWTRRRVDLPTYAFQRSRFWPVPTAAPQPVDRPAAAADDFWAAVHAGAEPLADLLAVPADADRESLHRLVPRLARWHGERTERSTVDGWRYRIGWKTVPVPEQPVLSGTWWLLVPPGPEHEAFAAGCAAAVSEHGGTAVRIPVGADLLERGEPPVGLPAGGAGAPAGVLSLLALDERDHPEHPVLTTGLAATLALLRGPEWLPADVPVWSLTRHAVAVDPTTDPVGDTGPAVWALGRVAALEFPRRWGGLVDLAEPPDARARAALAAVLAGQTGEDQVAIRPSGPFGRRLNRAPVLATAGTIGTVATVGTAAGGGWRPHGTALVTGGTGAVGAHMARWLAAQGVAHLVLTSRRGDRAPGVPELVAQLNESGAKVTVAACDVADRDAVRAVLAAIPQEHPLTTVVHAAGVGDLTPLTGTTAARLAEVLDAKVAGARNLDALCGGATVEAFVLCSSAAAVWGGANQGAYAAANACLDTLALRRRARGKPATSIAWGPWAGGGMAATADPVHLRRRGFDLMSPAFAMTALRQAVERGEACVTVAAVDWTRFAPAFTAARPSPLLGDLPDVLALGAASPTVSTADAAGLRRDLADRPEHERAEAVVELVRTHAAAVLGYSVAADVDTDRAFRDLGFDSLSAVELRDRLGAATGLPLPATAVFDYPTPAVLARWLLGELFPRTAEPEADPEEQRIRRTLAGIPLSRLRSVGLLDLLLGLADGAEGDAAPAGPVTADALDEMDGASLLKLVTAGEEGR
jgi:acyl transferase domain-containing protein/acyl carrier protein